jgi:hypothetical protein
LDINGISKNIIIQWGTSSWTNKATITINLPISFTGHYSSIAGDTGSKRVAYATGNHTVTDFILYSAVASTTYGAYWIAIGY